MRHFIVVKNEFGKVISNKTFSSISTLEDHMKFNYENFSLESVEKCSTNTGYKFAIHYYITND